MKNRLKKVTQSLYYTQVIIMNQIINLQVIQIQHLSNHQLPPSPTTGTPKLKRPKNIITPELAASLDRTKVSDRKAAYILASTVKSMGQDINEYNINRQSI